MTTIAEKMNKDERNIEKGMLELMDRLHKFDTVEAHNLFLQSMALKYGELGQPEKPFTIRGGVELAGQMMKHPDFLPPPPTPEKGDDQL